MLALLSSNISVSPVHSVPVSIVSIVPVYPLVLCSAPSVSQSFFTITEKAPRQTPEPSPCLKKLLLLSY